MPKSNYVEMVNRAAVRPPLARIRLGMKRAKLVVSRVGWENGGQAMGPSIDRTEFGSITISGERYELLAQKEMKKSQLKTPPSKVPSIKVQDSAGDFRKANVGRSFQN